MAAIARIAANGSVASSAVLLTLPGASSGLTAKSSAVATQIAAKRGADRRPASAEARVRAVPAGATDGREAQAAYRATQPPSATSVAPWTYSRGGEHEDDRGRELLRPRDPCLRGLVEDPVLVALVRVEVRLQHRRAHVAGTTVLTRIPRGASSTASCCRDRVTAPFVALYASSP